MMNTFMNDFNDTRTPFFKSFSFLMIESILPGLAIWLTVGYDFGFTLNKNFPSPIIGYVLLICSSYFVYTFILIFLFYKLKFHRADHFTFAPMITLVLIFITVSGSFMGNNNLGIFLRFIVTLAAVIIIAPLFVFITVLIRNNEIKKQNDIEASLEAYKKGEVIPNKELLKAKRYQEKMIKDIEKKEDLEKFKADLDEKIKHEVQKNLEIEELKKEKINQKLDKKENKKRIKDKN